MQTVKTPYSLHLSRTLWQNTYRCIITNEENEYIANILIILGIPLKRSEIPENAPEALPHLNVQVEEVLIDNVHDLLSFEGFIADSLLTKFQTEHFSPEYCSFSYPGPSESITPDTPLI